MNFTRLLGQNDKIYKKYGDYCISELDNECFILCSSCQEEYQSEDEFWVHIREVHHCPLLQTTSTIMQRVQQTPYIVSIQQQQVPLPQDQYQDSSEAKRIKVESPTDSLLYAETEDLEELGDISDPDILNDLSPYLIKDDKLSPLSAKDKCDEPTKSTENAFQKQAFLNKTIDVERIACKSLLNSKVLKKLFMQMQRTNIEFKYKLNRLAQQVKVLEREIRDECATTRKKYMKIIPDTPLTSRDEVLILDGELHRSKEMRNNLHDEALLVHTESPDVYCRVIWRFIMTDEVSNQFCWRGVIDGDKVIKYPIKDMTMLDIFQSAFREKFPAQPLNTFKEKTITYFNKANERIKRSKLERSKMTKTYDDNSDDTFDDVFC